MWGRLYETALIVFSWKPTWGRGIFPAPAVLYVFCVRLEMPVMYKHISIRIICICSFLTQALIHRTFIINTVAIA